MMHYLLTILFFICADKQTKESLLHLYADFQKGDYEKVAAYPISNESSEKIRLLVAEAHLCLFKKTHEDIHSEAAKNLLLQLIAANDKELRPLYLLKDLHETRKDWQEAHALSIALLERVDTDQKGAILKDVAKLQSHFDPKGAYKTYETLGLTEKEYTLDSLYERAVLLYKARKYEKVIELITKERQQIQTPQLYFLLAESYKHLNNYNKAIEYFNCLIANKNTPSDLLKKALLNLLHIAQKKEDLKLFEVLLPQVNQHLHEEESFCDELFFYAKLLIANQELEKAESLLEGLVQNFPEHEKKADILFHLSKLLIKEKKFQKARLALIAFLEENKENKNRKEALSLLLEASEKIQSPSLLNEDVLNILKEKELLNFWSLAKCYQHIGNKEDLFIEAAEKAFAIVQEQEEKLWLHIHLFNAYTKQHNTTKARAHLTEAFCIDPKSLSQKNICYLADYYLSINDSALALQLLEKLVLINEKENLLCAFESSLFLEGAALKLSALYESLGRKEEAMKTAAALRRAQASYNFPWKMRLLTFFRLAHLYKVNNLNKKALCIYKEILATPGLPKDLELIASVENTRLELAQIQDLWQSHPKVKEALETFKRIQVEKHFVTEPIHIESALDHHDLRQSIAGAKNAPERSLLFLNRIKEDYEKENETTKEYLEGGKLFPEKAAIFNAYLLYVKAEIKRAKALIAQKTADTLQANTLRSQALMSLKEIISDQNITEYLKTRVELSIKSCEENR